MVRKKKTQKPTISFLFQRFHFPVIFQPCSRRSILLYKVFIWELYIITSQKLIYYSISNCETSAVSGSSRKESHSEYVRKPRVLKGYKMRWGRTESSCSQNTPWREEAHGNSVFHAWTPLLHVLSPLLSYSFLGICPFPPSHGNVFSQLRQPPGFCCLPSLRNSAHFCIILCTAFLSLWNKIFLGFWPCSFIKQPHWTEFSCPAPSVTVCLCLPFYNQW